MEGPVSAEDRKRLTELIEKSEDDCQGAMERRDMLWMVPRLASPLSVDQLTTVTKMLIALQTKPMQVD